MSETNAGTMTAKERERLEKLINAKARAAVADAVQGFAVEQHLHQPGLHVAEIVSAQAAIGVLNLWLLVPIPMQMVHLGGADVLFILDPGTNAGGELSLTATVSGKLTGTITVSIPVGAMPAGDATRGAATYGTTGANCASCHGATAHGTDAGANGMYMYANATYAYPAPGLNTESGNLASDPTWSAALLAMAARADMDNGGLTLRVPMPSWLSAPDPATGQALTTQDYADVYAFLETQSQ